MRTTALIGYTIVETLDVRLTVGLAAIEIESIAVAGTRWNEITYTFARLVIGQVMT